MNRWHLGDSWRSLPLSVRRSVPVVVLIVIAAVWLASVLRQIPTPPAIQPRPQPPQGEALQKTLAAFEDYAEQVQREWEVPGMAIAIVQDDQVVYSRGFGVKTLGENDPVDEHTVFQIGSNSKAFTAALVATEVDEGRITWDHKVVDYLPDFQMFEPWVTKEMLVDDLMAQHSGLASYAGDAQAFVGFDRQHIVQSLRYFQPVSSFRSDFAYQNGLFLVAAALLEKTSGRSWEANLQERIFTPLGMSESSADLASFEHGTNVASLYQRVAGQVVRLASDWPYLDWTYIYGPAGGINASVFDMAKWLRLQLNEGRFEGRTIVSPQNLAFTHDPRTPISGGLFGDLLFYAQGWMYEVHWPYPLVWHNGETSGAHSVVGLIPETRTGIVVLTNLAGEGNAPEALLLGFSDLWFGQPGRDYSALFREQMAAHAPATTPSPTAAAANAPVPLLSDYAGTYWNVVYGEATVTVEGDSLSLTVGPTPAIIRLVPVSREVFRIYWDGISAGEQELQFQFGPDGRAQTMAGNLFDKASGVVFTRVE